MEWVSVIWGMTKVAQRGGVSAWEGAAGARADEVRIYGAGFEKSRPCISCGAEFGSWHSRKRTRMEIRTAQQA